MIEVALKARENGNPVRITSITGLEVQETEDLWNLILSVLDPGWSDLQAMTMAATQIVHGRGNLEFWAVTLHWPSGLVSRIEYSVSSVGVVPSVHRVSRYEREPVI
jgi:hypothetical protein